MEFLQCNALSSDKEDDEKRLENEEKIMKIMDMPIFKLYIEG